MCGPHQDIDIIFRPVLKAFRLDIAALDRYNSNIWKFPNGLDGSFSRSQVTLSWLGPAYFSSRKICKFCFHFFEIDKVATGQIPYLFEYNAQNFVRNFNQKLRVRVIHEFFHQHALFLFLFVSFIIFLHPLLILFAGMRNPCFFLLSL